MSICAIFNGTLTGLTYYNNVTDIVINSNGKKINYTIYPKPEISRGDDAPTSLSSFRAYTLSDGTIVGLFKRLGEYPCTLDIGKQIGDSYGSGNLAACFGFIDVNGASLPNREVTCSSGSNSLSKNDCIVKNDAQHMTDIFPIRIHDGIVEPASAAGRYILRTTK